MRVGETLSDHDFEAAAVKLRERLKREPTEEALLSDALYPQVFDEYWAFRREYGQVAHLPTPALLYGLEVGESVLVEIEPGKTLVVKLMAVGGLTADGHRNVYFELNGQGREVAVIDRTASEHIETRPKADPGVAGHVGASMPGKVVSIERQVGDRITPEVTLLVVEAMKMETSVSANINGTVSSILVREGERVQAGDLLIVVEPE